MFIRDDNFKDIVYNFNDLHDEELIVEKDLENLTPAERRYIIVNMHNKDLCLSIINKWK